MLQYYVKLHYYITLSVIYRKYMYIYIIFINNNIEAQYCVSNYIDS